MEEGPRAHGAEAGGLRPQAQGRLEPTEAGRAGRPCPGALDQLDFRLCPAGSEGRHVCRHELPRLGALAPATPATRVTRCLLSTEQLISDTSASEMPPALPADGETEARALRRADLSGWGGIRASPLHRSPRSTQPCSELRAIPGPLEASGLCRRPNTRTLVWTCASRACSQLVACVQARLGQQEPRQRQVAGVQPYLTREVGSFTQFSPNPALSVSTWAGCALVWTPLGWVVGTQ